ncbi:MAG: DUF742 domain-containing protein [Actinomycetota bacterium]|nr:DUF742 domain-containing protein [Actinomycetota bacterium]
MEADQNSREGRDADGPVIGLTGARFGGAAGRRRRAVAQPEEDDAVASRHQPQNEDQVVGQTGARFPSLVSRWRQKQEQQDPGQQDPELHGPEQQDPEQQDPEQLIAEATGAQRPPNQQQPGRAAGAQPDIALPVPEPAGAEEVDEAGWDRSKETSDLVRPYFWTGGRTAAQVDLAVETLVSATGRPPDPPARPEHCTILGLCANPRSVAELAALLKMPLGVARVVLGDLAATGNVSVHRTVGSADATPDVDLLQRVLTGLRRL